MTSNWTVQQSKSDPGTMEVRGAYLVADHLPIEDANLIAAAPDLYDALRTITGFMDKHFRGAEAVEDAKAALAKARGEPKSLPTDRQKVVPVD